MKFDYYTYHLASHFLPAIINGDRTGLDDSEETLLNIWLDHLPVVSGHFDVISEESDLKICNITDLWSDCFKVRFYFQTEETTQ